MTQEQGNQIAQEAIEQFPSSENLFYAKRHGYTTAATKYLSTIEQKDKEIGELSIHYFNHVHEIERLKKLVDEQYQNGVNKGGN